MDFTTIKKATLEVLRLAVFAIPGALILLFTQQPDLAGAYGIPILFILRAIDKGIHDNKEIDLKGILPF